MMFLLRQDARGGEHGGEQVEGHGRVERGCEFVARGIEPVKPVDRCRLAHYYDVVVYRSILGHSAVYSE